MTDAPSRTERLLNLLALLLDTRRPLTRDELVREVAGYSEATSANRRAFERDKEALRAMGVPITVAPTEGPGSEVGYLVDPAEYYLPDLGLTPEESAALHVAVHAVSLGSEAGEEALLKLGAFGSAAPPPIASLPMVPALAALFEAFRTRAVVTFEYRDETRVVEPWGLTSRRGRWYLVGFDRGRDAIRSFRADRVQGDVQVGAPDAFTPPADFRPDDHLEDRPWLLGDEVPVTAHIHVDAGHVEGARAELGAEAMVDPQPDGSAIVHFAVTNRAAFRTFVLGFLDHAEVLGPDVLRDDVVAWLTALTGERR